MDRQSQDANDDDGQNARDLHNASIDSGVDFDDDEIVGAGQRDGEAESIELFVEHNGINQFDIMSMAAVP